MYKGTISETATFGELKEWFETNFDMLPTTTEDECAIYCNVRHTVKLYINQVEVEVKRLGAKNIKKSALARAAKYGLKNIYLSLQNPEMDNLSLPRTQLDIDERNEKLKT